MWLRFQCRHTAFWSSGDSEDVEHTDYESDDADDGEDAPQGLLTRAPIGRVGGLDLLDEDVREHNRAEGDADDASDKAGHFLK